MVLQRGKPVHIFGFADPGSPVTVRWRHLSSSTHADTQGRWFVTFPAGRAGGPFSLSVSDGFMEISFHDIYLGDLWLCSGQSNMEWTVANSLHAGDEIAAAHHPLIRHFKVERHPSPVACDDVSGSWTVCHPRSVGSFTAVGYFFAARILRRTRVAIGLLHSSWGGTPIEAWLPREAFPSACKSLLRFQRLLETDPAKLDPTIRRQYRLWEKKYVSKDPGNKGISLGWASPHFDDTSWPRMNVPGAWEGQGLLIDGAVWFRRSVDIPRRWAGRPLRLELGSLDDFDVTWFNGVEIGRTGEDFPDAFRHPREYTVPASLVRPGPATIAVRIFDRFGSGGFTNVAGRQFLSCPGSSGGISLTGPWPFQVEWSVDRSLASPPPPALPEPRSQLSYLYNGMIHPLVNFPIRGFLWYQGESNASRSSTYESLFSSLVQSWRRLWKDDSLPFYYAQLANFKSVPVSPGDDTWAEIREAQTRILRLPHTGMAVTIDVGEAADIHPRDKQSVGHRLALLALSGTYGKKVAAHGPFLRKCEFLSSRIKLRFSHVGRGLKSRDGGDIRGFAVAGPSRRWVWATARITTPETIVITHPLSQEKPVALRYGWAGNPGSNLVNSHGLPACPFRTDDWPLATSGEKWPF